MDNQFNIQQPRVNPSPFFKARLNGKQSALGLIILLPSYLFCIPILCNFIIYLFLRMGFTTDTATLNVWLNLMSDITCLILALWFMGGFVKESIQAYKEKAGINTLFCFTAGIGMVYGFAIIANLIISLITGGSTGTSSNQTAINTMVKDHLPAMVLMTCIIAPILEELIFRGLIFSKIREKNVILAHLISAFLFGFLHIYSGLLAGDSSQWLYLLSYGGMGLGFSLVYELRGNICCCMLVHCINNVIALALNVM